MIERIRRERILSHGQASKLRGKAMWLDTAITGRSCRGALAAITARQYWEGDASVTSNLDAALEYLQLAAEAMPDRLVSLHPGAARPLLVYTDASDEGGRARVGALVVEPGRPAQALVYDVPDSVREEWGPQRTIINQAELYAAPLLACSAPRVLRGRDVIWFIDNTSAETALIKASSPTESMCRPALYAQAALAALRTRVWYEHIPSADNPADVLSRAGFADEGVQQLLDAEQWVPLPPVAPPPLGSTSLRALWEYVAVLGGCPQPEGPECYH